MTEAFRGGGFGLFARAIERTARWCGRFRPRPTAGNPRSFFDKMNDWARGEGAAGLGYIVYGADGEAQGPDRQEPGAGADSGPDT